MFAFHTLALRACRTRCPQRWFAAAFLALGLSPLCAGAKTSPSDLQYPAEVSASAEPRVLPSTNEGLTLAELEERACQANPSIQRLAALVNAARGATYQAGLPPNPRIGYEGQQLGSNGQAEQHGVLFSQEIVRGGKLQLDAAIADRERMKLQQQLVVEQLKGLTQIRLAFYEALVAQRRIEIATQLETLASEGNKSVAQLFKAGEVGKADVLQAELELESARILFATARETQLAAWRKLGAALGEPTLAMQPLVDHSAEESLALEYEIQLTRLLDGSPEIAAARVEITRARCALRRAQVEPVPNVNVQGLYNWQDNGIGGRDDGGVQVTMPVPLFNRNQGAIAEAQCQLAAAHQALRVLERELSERLAAELQRHSTARVQTDRYRTLVLPAAEESLKLTRELYEAGETNYTALLTAQRTYVQMHLTYLESLQVLRTAEVRIEGLLVDQPPRP